MDSAWLTLWIFFLLCVCVENFNETLKCEKLKKSQCYNIDLSYKYTTQIFVTDSKDQAQAAKNLEKWKPLKYHPRCWKYLQSFLCRVYLPECISYNNSVSKVILPCRRSCLYIRKPCEVVQSYGGWPEFLKCERFPLVDCVNLTTSAINGTDNNCPPQLVHTKDSTGWFEKIHGCGVPCENPIFTEEEHGRIRRFIGAFGSLSMLCTAFTVITFLVGWKSQNKYPSVILFYMNACFCLTYLGFLLQFFGNARKKILCRYDDTMRRGEPVDSDSTICVFTFILVFYFSTAGVVWFVILTYAWYICFQSLGTTRDILSNKAVYFHIIAWTQPLILTCIIIALAQIDSDSLSGICFVGYWNINFRIYFVLVPLGINLVISAIFLWRGLMILFKLRKSNPHMLSLRSASRIKETITRIGIFAFLAFAFVVTTFACHLYDFFNQKTWRRGFRDFIKCKAEATVKQISDPCKVEDRPDLGVIELHLFALFGAGIAMSAWSWTSSTLSSWKNAWNKLTGKRRYPELSHYNLIRRLREIKKIQAEVHPSSEPVNDKNMENKITAPQFNEESLQLQSIISDISVIADPKLIIPTKRRVLFETNEHNEHNEEISE